MANPASPTRGVLMKKSTNAFVQHHGRDSNETTKMNFWTFKMLRNDAVALEKAAPAPKIGQKRSIAQVDGTAEHDPSPLKHEASSPVKEFSEDEKESLSEDGEDGEDATEAKIQMESVVNKEDDDATEAESEPETELENVPKKEEDDATEAKSEPETVLENVPKTEEDATEPLSAESKATTNMPLASFHASQEGPLPIEEQFDIQDEASQETLENLNMTPLPQNTPQADMEPAPRTASEGSQDSTRMSSFIDFDGKSGAKDVEERTLAKATVPLSGAARKAMLDGTAETLRTRLQLAAYKVRTNQIYTPFRWLHRGQGSPEPRPLMPIKVEEEESADTAARSEVADPKKRAAEELNSLPMRTVLPAAYSAPHTAVPKEEVASSPPPSTCSEDTDTSRMPPPETPTSEKSNQPRTPMPLSSPPGGQIGERKCDAALQGKQWNRDLTSSALKGEAAKGLLELIRAAAES